MRSLWLVAPSGLHAVPFGAAAAVTSTGRVVALEADDLVRDDAAGPAAVAAATSRSPASWRVDQVALVVRVGRATWLCTPRTTLGAASAVLLDGLPVVGGLARLRHGQWLTIVGAGPRAIRLWASREGPRTGSPARTSGVDSFTFAEVAPGDPVVDCACGALYRVETWADTRRCCRCGDTENGAYAELPPGSGSRDS